jgi:hypothetical protein
MSFRRNGDASQGRLLMSFVKRIPIAVAAMGSLMMVSAGVAHADNTATAVSVNNPGLLSGVSNADVLSDPLNNCANHNASAASLLSGTSENVCLIK